MLRTVSNFYLPEGFRADLIASEPKVVQPIAFTIDERGRLWVAEALSYPQKRPEGEGLDRITVLEDADADGTFEGRRIFARGLNLVSGFEVGYGGVWVGAAPELLFIPDADRDAVPDGPPEVILDGWGYQDTHETPNSFTWGPDGWLYGNQGVFNTSHVGVPGAKPEDRVMLHACVWRYHPVDRKFEVFAHGGSNQWGIDFDEFGELFMTHCRSYWGGGPTTHVALRGHYWNQANARHAPFVSGQHPPGAPEYRNFLRASARYGHGEGGAGQRGSRALYGGHSHVGTMLYFGDNWPDEYRGDLYTHNLHGHRVNRQANRPAGSGYETVHAGEDFLFVDDPRYVAVDLDYGPDGSVFVIDWYDRQHCHSPHMERWDRSNGRIYRVSYAPTFRTRSVDLGAMSNEDLAELHTHENEWYVRTARRILHERFSADGANGSGLDALYPLLEDDDPVKILRALWTLHVTRKLGDRELDRALASSLDRVRAWAVRLATERPSSDARFQRLLELATSDPSPVVRLALASYLADAPAERAWPLAERLVRHAEDASDANLPGMIWFGIAPHVPGDLGRALALAQSTRIEPIEDFVYWYVAKTSDGLDRLFGGLAERIPAQQVRVLRAAEFARGGVALAETPRSWSEIAAELYASPNGDVRAAAERFGALVAHAPVLAKLRETLADTTAESSARRRAFDALQRVADPASLPLYLELLAGEEYRTDAISVLAKFDDPRIATTLIAQYPNLSANDRRRALSTLTARASFAKPLLEAIAAGRIDEKQLGSFHVRQLRSLADERVDALVTKVWGEARETQEDVKKRIAAYVKTFREAPLWAYDAGAGKAVYDKTCATCHSKTTPAGQLGPDLAGAGRNGVEYFLESVLDPNAVVGEDFQLSVVVTKTGSVVSGVVQDESDESVTIRTPDDRRVIRKKDIQARTKKTESVMPEGLLDTLSQREVIELLKYLSSM